MSAFPTLTRPPIYPLSPDGDLEDAALRGGFEAGYEQSRPKFTRARRNFGLSYRLSDGDVATLRNFESTTLKNGSDAFVWTHPVSSTSYTVRLAGPIKYSKSSFGMSDVSIGLREV